MKVVIQRVNRASVKVDSKVVGKIGRGLAILIGIAETDEISDVDFIADKCVNLRIFEDENGKMNRSVLEEGGEILAISQFTLLGSAKKGRRPSFIEAAKPEKGNALYNAFVEKLKTSRLKIECGVFGAMMDVDLVNYGPVTLIVESRE